MTNSFFPEINERQFQPIGKKKIIVCRVNSGRRFVCKQWPCRVSRSSTKLICKNCSTTRTQIVPKKTVKASVCVFEQYLAVRGKTLTFFDSENASTQDCDDILRKFYAETRKADGTKYAKKSLITIRYGLQKHFLRSRDEDIINDKRYAKSNAIFKAVLVQLKKDGIGEPVSKEQLTPEDINTLYTGPAFNTDNPSGLQRKVIFEYLYFFCNRGRENLREVKKGDFTVAVDSTGREYVTVTNKQTKNHRGDDTYDKENKQGRMYDKPGSSLCPVLSFKEYARKLHPDNPCFWQRPKRREFNAHNEIWYENVPVGKNTLYNFMQKMSEEYNLSKHYTNHCIRATSITTLDHNDIEARHIMSVSGHKSENSIKCYSANLSDKKKRQMPDILSDILPSKTLKVNHSEAKSSSNNYTTSIQKDTVNSMAALHVQHTPSQFPDLDLFGNEFDDIDIDNLLAQINEHVLVGVSNMTLGSGIKPNVPTLKFSNCNVNVTINMAK